MAKIFFIDEKGRLFGLINLLDLIVLLSLLIILYLGLSAYLALKSGVPQIVDFSPKQIANDKVNNITLVLKNDRRIGSTKVTMIPHDFVGERILPPTSFEKRTRNEITVSVPAGVPSGNYLFELELVIHDVINRQSLHVISLDKPIKIEQKQAVEVVETKPGYPLYPWPVEVDVLFPLNAGNKNELLKAEDRMVDTHDRVIAEIISIRASRSSDTLNLTGKPGWQGKSSFKGSKTARMRLIPEIVQNRLTFQGKLIAAGEQFNFQKDNAVLEGYIIGKGSVNFQRIGRSLEVLAEIVLLGIQKQHANFLKPKSVQIDDSGQAWAEILEITNRESKIKDSQKNLVVRMFINCFYRKGRLFCQNVLVEQGAVLNFTFGNQQVSGFIRKITYPEWINVEVQLNNVTPDQVLLLRKGVQEEVEGREATIEIEKIVSEQPSINYINPYYSLGGLGPEGKRTWLPHPSNKDIKCRFKIKGFRVGKRIFYNRTQLFLDSPIIFETSTWKLSGVLSQFIR